jgi:hypothetical protein
LTAQPVLQPSAFIDVPGSSVMWKWLVFSGFLMGDLVEQSLSKLLKWTGLQTSVDHYLWTGCDKRSRVSEANIIVSLF